VSRPDWLRSSAVDVSAHLYESTSFVPRVYVDEDRATLRIDGSGGGVTLYADRSDLARLRDALADVLADLNAQRTTLTTTCVETPAPDSAA
jgi:hypothetical protein